VKWKQAKGCRDFKTLEFSVNHAKGVARAVELRVTILWGFNGIRRNRAQKSPLISTDSFEIWLELEPNDRTQSIEVAGELVPQEIN